MNYAVVKFTTIKPYEYISKYHKVENKATNT